MLTDGDDDGGDDDPFPRLVGTGQVGPSSPAGNLNGQFGLSCVNLIFYHCQTASVILSEDNVVVSTISLDTCVCVFPTRSGITQTGWTV